MKQNKVHASSKRKMQLNIKKPFIVKGLAIVAFLFALPLLSSAQGQPNILKDWTMLGESSNHIDVSYRLVKCNLATPNQIHLTILNENPTSQVVSMSIKVINNANGENTIFPVNYTIGAAALKRGDCADAASNALKINIPSAYNASNLTLQVTFN